MNASACSERHEKLQFVHIKFWIVSMRNRFVNIINCLLRFVKVKYRSQYTKNWSMNIEIDIKNWSVNIRSRFVHIRCWFVNMRWHTASDKGCPPAPMNHVKMFSGWPPEMPLRSWYNCGTKHFRLTMMVRWKWETQLDWVIKPVPHDLVRRIRFWRIKCPQQDLKYSTIRKIRFWNLFTCKGT